LAHALKSNTKLTGLGLLGNTRIKDQSLLDNIDHLLQRNEVSYGDKCKRYFSVIMLLVL
jgi:hypothetical protein